MIAKLKQYLQKTESKRGLLTIVLTFIVLLILTVVLVKNDFSLKQSFLIKEARIDVLTTWGDNLKLTTESDADVSYPTWANNSHGQGMVLTFPIKWRWETKKIEVRVINDGEVCLHLRSPNIIENENHIPVMVSYQNLRINGEKIDLPHHNFWHDEPFRYNLKVKDKDIITVMVDVRKPIENILLKPIEDNIPIFISTFFLCLLIFRRFLYYCSQFYDVQQSCIDIVFIAIFYGLLFVPMMHISDAEKSEQENRTLVKKPLLLQDGKINNNYGNQFNDWFNDRFWWRDEIVKFYNRLIYTATSNLYISSKACVNKKTKWIGSCHTQRSLFSNEQLEKASRSVSKLMNFANKHNIKVYFLIAPVKASIYGKDILPWNKDSNEHIYQLSNYLKRKNSIKVIYPYNEILKASKNDFMFFKTDTHWTDAAAYIAYIEVMKEIKKDLKDIKVAMDDDFEYVYSNKVKVAQEAGFHNGNYNVLGLDDKRFFDVKYKYYMHKRREKLNQRIVKYPEKSYIVRYFSYDTGKYNLTLFGDSFGENLEPIIPYSFAKTLRIYTFVPERKQLESNINIKRFETDILNNNTDVLIICFSEIDRLMYLYKD